MTARRTPEATLVRQAASCSFLLGALIAFPGVMGPVWSLQLNLSSQAIARLFLILLGGLLVGALGARRLAVRNRIHTLAGVSGVIASMSLFSMATAYVPERLWGAALGLGLSLGMLVLAQSTLLFQPVAASPHSFALSGFFFGSGAVTVICLISALLDTVDVKTMNLLPAVLPLFFSLQFFLAKPALPDTSSAADFRWGAVWSPAVVLLVLVVLLHGAVLGVAACWLATYLGRTFGASFQFSLVMLGLYWFCLTLSCLSAKRLPLLENRVRWLALVALGFATGCAFLLETTTISGAVAGTAIVGSTTGALQALTTGWLCRHVDWRHLAWFRGLSVAFIAGSIGAACAVGYLITFGGAVSIVWSLLANGLLLVVSLATLLIEARLLKKRSAVY